MNEEPGNAMVPVGDPSLQEFGWRNTPRINFAPERRIIPASPLVVLILVLLLIEVLSVPIVYGRLRSAQDEALSAKDRLENVERTLRQEVAATDDVIARIGEIDEEINQVVQQSAGVFEVYNRLTQNRPDWAASLQALLQADSEDFRINRLETNSPASVDSPSQINLSATAAGTDTIGGFLDYMGAVDDFLDLASWNTARTSSNKITLDAVVNLK